MEQRPWESVEESFEKFIQSGDSDGYEDLCRYLRKQFASNPTIQDEAISHRIHLLLCHATKKLLTHGASSQDLIKFSAQTLCNLLTGNQDNQLALLRDWIQDSELDDFLPALLDTRNDQIVIPTLVIINNCCTDNPSFSSLFLQSTFGQGFLAKLLYYSQQWSSDDSNLLFDLAYVIFSNWFEQDLLATLIEIFNQQLYPSIAISSTIYLYKLLDGKIANGYSPSSTTVEFLALGYVNLINSISPSLSELDSKSSIEIEELVDKHSLIASHLSLLTVISQEDDSEARSQLFNLRILPPTIGFLQKIHQIFPPTKQIGTSNTLSPPQNALKHFASLKRDLMKIIANLSFRNPAAQNEVREMDSITLILELTNLDDQNPFLREHAILALRNVLEDNFENQQVVASLQAIRTLQTPVLDDLGLTTVIEDGQVKIRKQSS